MKEEADFLKEMFTKVAKQIGKPYQAVAPFEQELRKNWYDTPESLQNVTDDQYTKMGVPLRVATAIRQQIYNALGKNSEVIPPQPSNISLPKEQLKQQKVQKNTKPVLNEAAILLLVQDLQNSLLENYPYVGEQLLKIFQTLHKVIKNIVADTYQLKFRVLKKSNQKIKEIILQNQPVVKFLKAIGFEQDQEALLLHTFDTQALFFVQECLDQIEQNHRNQTNSQGKIFQNKPKKQAKRQDFFLPPDLKLPSNNESVSLKDAFSKQSLDQANYAELLDKLLQFRKKIMSTPPKSRQIKIYHKRYEVRQTDCVMVNIEKEMEFSDNAILGKYWRQVIQNNKKNSLFQSRRKTQFQYLLKQQVYRQTTIKLRLPNELIIEARFGPLETLGDVHAVVAQIVIGQLYIYQAPPVKRLDKEMHRTLDSLDSVPNGSYYIGLQTEWYIKNEFTKNIKQ